jgi:hypothetical protein
MQRRVAVTLSRRKITLYIVSTNVCAIAGTGGSKKISHIANLYIQIKKKRFFLTKLVLGEEVLREAHALVRGRHRLTALGDGCFVTLH